MKKQIIMIIAASIILAAPCFTMGKEEPIYSPPEFYVQTESGSETVDLRNSVGEEAYPVGMIPGGTILHVTDLVYDREEDSFWVLVSYEGISGWIDLSKTLILRGSAADLPEDESETASDLPAGYAGDPEEVTVFVSVEKELELMGSPEAEEVKAVVSDTTPLYFYGTESIVEDSLYSWYQVSVPGGETGWVRADQVIMAGSQKVLDQKEKTREEEQRKEEERKTQDDGEETEEQTVEDLIAAYNEEHTGSFVNYEEGRIITIGEDTITNEVFTPKTWEKISEESYYYVARTAALRPEDSSEESCRMIAFNDTDASDVWILFYDPFKPDLLLEEYKTGEWQEADGTLFHRTENQ